MQARVWYFPYASLFMAYISVCRDRLFFLELAKPLVKNINGGPQPRAAIFIS